MSATDPKCHLCGKPITDTRITYVHRDGELRPVHDKCLHPKPHTHVVVIR